MNTKIKPTIPQARQPKEIRTPEGMIPFTHNAVSKYIAQQAEEIAGLHKVNAEMYDELQEIKKKLDGPKLTLAEAELLNHAKKQILSLTEAAGMFGFTEEQARKYQCLIDLIVELRP